MQPRLERAVVSALAGLLAVPATYAALRAYEALFTVEVNPATVIWSARIAMFWRLGIGAYVAGLVFALAWTLSRGRTARAVRVLSVASLVVAGAITAQGALLP